MTTVRTVLLENLTWKERYFITKKRSTLPNSYFKVQYPGLLSTHLGNSPRHKSILTTSTALGPPQAKKPERFVPHSVLPENLSPASKRHDLLLERLEIPLNEHEPADFHLERLSSPTATKTLTATSSQHHELSTFTHSHQLILSLPKVPTHLIFRLQDRLQVFLPESQYMELLFSTTGYEEKHPSRSLVYL